MEYVTLSNGIKMPKIGYGVLDIDNLAECEKVVTQAIEAGYRLIDTAAAYMNEEAVGKAIKNSGVDREKLFVTTKIWIQDMGYENTKKAIEASLNKLNLEYLDLLLIHFPFGDYYGSWRAMEELYQEGKLKAIGVSNFYGARLVDLCLNATIKPMVNQMEMHPLYQQNDELETMKKYKVQPEAWRPLGQGRHDIFNNEVLKTIALKHKKTVAQIMLRWNIERAVVVLPKSMNKERMIENLNIWDFKLDVDDKIKIATLGINTTDNVSLSAPEAAEQLNSWNIHD